MEYVKCKFNTRRVKQKIVPAPADDTLQLSYRKSIQMHFTEDFNKANVKSVLLHFSQHVICTAREKICSHVFKH